jgi:hypothetical protein
MTETSDATFAITQTIEAGYTRFNFVHDGGVARNTILHLGILVDGIARSGDGWEAGDVDRDLLAVLFNAAEIDQSTVRADYTAGFTADARVAIFLTWSSGANDLISAIGIETSFTERQGFEAGRALEGPGARDFLTGAGMLDESAIRATPADAIPEARYFDELKVEGYRGFAVEQSLRFARPPDRQDRASPYSSVPTTVASPRLSKPFSSPHVLGTRRSSTSRSLAGTATSTRSRLSFREKTVGVYQFVRSDKVAVRPQRRGCRRR